MRLARILSYVFHPVFMPVLGVAVIFNSGIYVADIPFEFKRFVYAMVLLCTVILPLALLPSLYIFKLVKSIRLDDRHERILPLVLTTLSFYLGYFLLSRYSPVKIVNVFLFGSVLVVLGCLLCSLFWKISLHMAGIGGLLALIMVISFAYTRDLTTYLSLAFLVAGITGTSRLALQAHNLAQVTAGFFLGMIIMGATLYQFII